MTALRSILEAGLAGRSAVEEEIGQGGMAVVYRALDQRHHRAVGREVASALDYAHRLGDVHP